MAASELLSLRWNNHSKTFMEILSCLQTKSSFTDATIACDGKLYPVHKFVLSICSEYFEEILNTIVDKHPVIVLKDITGDVFEALLKYMYVGEVNVEQNKLSKFISAAECLMIKGLAVPDEEETNYESKSTRKSTSNAEKRRYRSSDTTNEFSPPNKLHRGQYSFNGVNNNASNFDRQPKNNVRQTDTVQEKYSSGYCSNNEQRKAFASTASGSKAKTESTKKTEPQEVVVFNNTAIKEECDEILVEDDSSMSDGQQHSQYDSPTATDSGMQYTAPKRSASSVMYNRTDVFTSSNTEDQQGAATAGENIKSTSADDRLENDVKESIDKCEDYWSLSESPMSPLQHQQQLQDFSAQRRHSSDDLHFNYQQQSEFDNFMTSISPFSRSILNNSSTGSGGTTSNNRLVNKTSVSPKSLLQHGNSSEYHDPANVPVVMSGPKSNVPYEKRQYPCSYCPYRATVKCNLMMHLRKHTGEKPYSCSICGFTTAFQQSLQRHFKKAHNGRAVFENNNSGSIVALATSGIGNNFSLPTSGAPNNSRTGNGISLSTSGGSHSNNRTGNSIPLRTPSSSNNNFVSIPGSALHASTNKQTPITDRNSFGDVNDLDNILQPVNVDKRIIERESCRSVSRDSVDSSNSNQMLGISNLAEMSSESSTVLNNFAFENVDNSTSNKYNSASGNERSSVSSDLNRRSTSEDAKHSSSDDLFSSNQNSVGWSSANSLLSDNDHVNAATDSAVGGAHNDGESAVVGPIAGDAHSDVESTSMQQKDDESKDNNTDSEQHLDSQTLVSLM